MAVFTTPPRERTGQNTARILIAAPAGSWLAYYREVLAGRGLQVATATTGLDCLAKLRAFHPDVLLLEPDLPWGQGEGILALMEEEADIPKIPVIVVSAVTDQARSIDHHTLPRVIYRVKPLAPGDLVGCIHQLVGDGVS